MTWCNAWCVVRRVVDYMEGHFAGNLVVCCYQIWRGIWLFAVIGVQVCKDAQIIVSKVNEEPTSSNFVSTL